MSTLDICRAAGGLDPIESSSLDNVSIIHSKSFNITIIVISLLLVAILIGTIVYLSFLRSKSDYLIINYQEDDMMNQPSKMSLNYPQTEMNYQQQANIIVPNISDYYMGQKAKQINKKKINDSNSNKHDISINVDI